MNKTKTNNKKIKQTKHIHYVHRKMDEKNKTSRIIIIKNNKILLIHRLKEGKEYYVLPGGGIEKNESPKRTAIREALEETNLKIIKIKKLFEYKDKYHQGYYYLAEEFSGKAKEGKGEEFQNKDKNNKYSLKWINSEELKKIIFYPKKLRKTIIDFLR